MLAKLIDNKPATVAVVGLWAIVTVTVLGGCGGGDINIGATNVTPESGSTPPLPPPSSTNACA